MGRLERINREEKNTVENVKRERPKKMWNETMSNDMKRKNLTFEDVQHRAK